MRPYEKVHRLRDLAGIDFKRMSEYAKKSGSKYPPDQKTFRLIYQKGPDRPCRDNVRDAVYSAHNYEFQGKHDLPLTEDLIEQRDKYYEFYRNENDDSITKLEKELIKERDLLERLSGYQDFSDGDKKQLAGIYWILLRINNDRVRKYRDVNWMESEKDKNFKDGKYNFQRALDLYGSLSGIGSNVEYALRISGIALDVNWIPTKDKEYDPCRVKELFEKSEHEKYAKALLEEESFQWLPAWNLMVEYRYKEDENLFVQAFERLVNACPSFRRLGYNPVIVKPLKEDPDLKNYLDVLRDLGYKD